jgi:pilus assembly protein FimV
MPRALLAAVPLLAVLFPVAAGALGLGEIRLQSALNEPFRAEIPLSADSAEEVGGVEVRLAGAEVFDRFGIDRPAFLSGFTFTVVPGGRGGSVRVTSRQPVSEPFVSLLVEVTWANGRLLREYTVLLDPPVFAGADTPRQVAAPPVAASPRPAPSLRPEPEAPPMPAAAPRAPRPAAAPDGSYGPVRPNETLWAIAQRVRPDESISQNQMMVALFRANPEAFAGNINRLRAGAILRVPPGSELAAASAAAATAEVARQNDAWRGRTAIAGEPRLQLRPPADEQPAPPAAPTAKAAVQPPAGTAAVAGDGTQKQADAAGSVQQLRAELAERQRLLEIESRELQALQARLAAAEQDAVPAPKASTSAETAAAGTAATAPATRSAEPQRAKPAPAASSSWLAAIGKTISSAWFLIAAAVALLAGMFVIFSRRRMTAEADITGRFAVDMRRGTTAEATSAAPAREERTSPPSARAQAPVASKIVVEESGEDRTVIAPAPGPALRGREESRFEKTISAEAAVEIDQADVIAEADFHMAYGLYDQAAEILNRALQKAPGRSDLRLKLLEVYFIWENRASFVTEAKTFRAQMGDRPGPDWNKVIIMGKQICPDEPLFAGAVGASGDDTGVDLALGDDSRGGVDFSIDDLGQDAVDLNLTAARPGPTMDSLDFELGDADSPDDTSLMQTGIREGDDAAGDSPTMETPTVESPYLDSPTVETPTIETPAAGRTPGRGPSAYARDMVDAPEATEEINLEDLGLDLTGLDQAAGELATGTHGSLDASAIRKFEPPPDADDGDDDALLLDLEGDATAESRRLELDDDGPLDLPAFSTAMKKSSRRGADITGLPGLDDTAEQPRADFSRFDPTGGGEAGVDFDVGEEAGDDVEPTAAVTGSRSPDGPTMTEVGTKLDLARAYIDMGDPDGARSILNEVLEEGDAGQRQEARKLLDDLAD